MLKKIGIEYGPVMIQGFYDNGAFRFYDPGRRFPGTDFELVYKKAFGIDLMKTMVVYALTGKMPEENLSDENALLNGETAVVLFPTLRMGTIGSVSGFEELNRDPKIGNIRQKHIPGDVIKTPNTTLQRIFEIDFTSDSLEDVKEIIRYIQNTIDVKDIAGRDMLYKPFDPDRL